MLVCAAFAGADTDDDSVLPAQPVQVGESIMPGELLIDFGPGIQALTSGDRFSIVLDGEVGPLLPLRDLARMPGGSLPSSVGTSGCLLIFINVPGMAPQPIIIPFSVTGHGSTLDAAVADYKAKYQQAVGNGVPVPCPPATPAS